MKIGIVYKKEKVKDRSIVTRLTEKFRSRGAEVKIMHTGAELHDVDCVVVLGGDGALLHAAVIAGKQHIKVVGVNYGNLGFLSEFEAAETEKAGDLVCGKHTVLPRTILQITLDGKVAYALNETVLQRDYARSYGHQVARFGLELNGEKIQDYVADGLAVATPTGSTAYSLSAGGCILSPDVRAFIVTPICAMGLKARPLVVADTGKFTFDLAAEKEDLKLYADGRPIGTVTPNSRVVIEKAPFTADFVTRNVNRLFQAVNRKLSG